MRNIELKLIILLLTLSAVILGYHIGHIRVCERVTRYLFDAGEPAFASEVFVNYCK